MCGYRNAKRERERDAESKTRYYSWLAFGLDACHTHTQSQAQAQAKWKMGKTEAGEKKHAEQNKIDAPVLGRTCGKCRLASLASLAFTGKIVKIANKYQFNALPLNGMGSCTA